MEILQIPRTVTDVHPETVFTIGGFPVANSFLMLLLLLGLILLFIVVSRGFKILPSKFQLLIEMVYEMMSGFIQQITGDSYHTKKIFPLVASLFIFIGVANFIGLIPGLTAFTYKNIPIFRTPTSDFNTTFSLAVAMMILLQVVSIKSWGFKGYVGKFVQIREVIQGFRKGIKEGSMAVVNFLIGLLDIISELAKVMSLSLRLFGNMYAGEVLMIILLGTVAYVVPSLWLAMNLLSAVVQATVFGALIATYYMLALKPAPEQSK